MKPDGIANAIDIAFGKAAPDSPDATIFLVGEIGDEFGVFRSIDDGATWDLISSFPLGYTSQVNTIEGDWTDFGKFYLGFADQGFAVGQPIEVIPEPATALLK